MHHQVSVAFEGVDVDTPQNEKLSAKYTKSFAYYTVKDRLPVTITKVINELATKKTQILEQPIEGAEEDIKTAIGKLSKLKNELVTNKSLIQLDSKGADVKEWNNYLECQSSSEEEPPCWYYSPFLYVECYMYRRMWAVFENSETLGDYDPFQSQKEEAFKVSLPVIKIMAKITLEALSQVESSRENFGGIFVQFLKLSLWSNTCDLSFSLTPSQFSGKNSNLHNIDELDSFLLCDDSKKVFDLLTSSRSNVIDFVNDNTAFEVFSDLCFCDILCTMSLASKIKFHLKKIPWYVSDTMIKDITWLLNKLDEEGLETLSERWKKYFQNGTWSLADETYWTMPFDYSEMKTRDPALYESLEASNLVIFKGDLNYRKLMGDINWAEIEDLGNAIRNFRPTNILTLRTVKADVISGLGKEALKHFQEGDRMWMRTGKYAVIQLCRRLIRD